MKNLYPILPTFLLKYKFNTYKYLQNTNAQILIFHGKDDEIIYYGSSLKLKEYFKESDKLISLDEQGHNGINYNPKYIDELKKYFDQLYPQDN